MAAKEFHDRRRIYQFCLELKGQTWSRGLTDSKARISTGLGAILSAGAQPDNVTPIEARALPGLAVPGIKPGTQSGDDAALNARNGTAQ